MGRRWRAARVAWCRLIACRAPEPTPSPHGSFGWRCQRHLWHGGAHRYRNYVWSGEQFPDFDPIPTRGTDVIQW